MKKGKCPKCGSGKIVPGVPIIDREHPSLTASALLSAQIVEKPAALFLTHINIFSIKAWICTSCGFAELYIDDPKGLSESYDRFKDNQKPG